MSFFLPKSFIRLLIGVIQKQIGITNYSFGEYRSHLQIKGTPTDLIIKKLLHPISIRKLLEKVKININKSNLSQAKRCIQVISLALLVCDNYTELFNKLKFMTGLADATIWGHIKKYIPYLKFLNSEIERWLPISKSIDYDIIEKSAKNLGFEITGVKCALIEPKNEEEWQTMSEGENKKSQIKIKIKCGKCEGEYDTTYNYIQRGRWPCDCGKNLYTSESTYDYYRLKDEIEKLGITYTGTKATLVKPANEDEFNQMRFEQNRSPTQLKIKVKCNKCGKIWETTVTSLVHQENWCGRCTDPRVYEYERIIDLVREITMNVIGVEGKLIYPRNMEEFKALANDYIPSQIPLAIRCGNCGNNVHSTAQYLQTGIFPCTCINLKYESIVGWYFYKLFGVRFNHMSLTNVIPNYSGRLEYDGYNELLVNDNCLTINDDRVSLDPYYLIKEPYNPIASGVNISRRFKYIHGREKDFIRAFRAMYFKDGDQITLDMSYGHIDFLYTKNKLILIRSKLYNDKETSIIITDVFKIAFEFNGRQHYEYPNAFHNDILNFFNQVVNDLVKKRLSFQNNIFLIVFPYWVDLKMDNPEKIQNYIISHSCIDISFLPQFDHRNPDFGQYRLVYFNF